MNTEETFIGLLTFRADEIWDPAIHGLEAKVEIFATESGDFRIGTIYVDEHARKLAGYFRFSAEEVKEFTRQELESEFLEFKKTSSNLFEDLKEDAHLEGMSMIEMLEEWY